MQAACCAAAAAAAGNSQLASRSYVFMLLSTIVQRAR